MSKNEKNIYCIRHGIAFHNVLFNKMGEIAYTLYQDTPLVHEGYLQADNLSKTWGKINDIELVLVSPLIRTIETCKTIFGSRLTTDIISLECLKEFPQGGTEIANKRKNKHLLKKNARCINFSLLDNDIIWEDNREDIDSLRNRINDLKKFINNRHEKNIAIVSHTSFLQVLMYNNLNKENELEHCKPYLLKL
tara:strand:- start:1012 stop:1590 length:579 start_codon:yes stop_codon:yes gene_type:complete